MGWVPSVRLIRLQISVEWFRTISVTGASNGSPPICGPIWRMVPGVGLGSQTLWWLRVRYRTFRAEFGFNRWKAGNFFGNELVSCPESGRVTRNCIISGTVGNLESAVGKGAGASLVRMMDLLPAKPV